MEVRIPPKTELLGILRNYVMKVLSKEKSKLIDRTEIVLESPHIGKATPNTNEIKKLIANEFKADENLIVVKLIDTKYGEGISYVSIYIYNNLDELKKLEKYQELKKEDKIEQKKESPKEKIKENDKEEKTKKQESK